MRRIVFGTMLSLFLVSMVSMSCRPALALVVGTITDLGIPVPGMGEVWALTTGLDGRIFGGASHMFFYDPLTEAFTDLGEPGVGVYALTTGSDGLIYGGSHTGSLACAHSAHFFVYDPTEAWNPGTGPDNNPYDMGPWSRLAGVPDAEMPDQAIIFDLVVGLNGKIYGGSGYGADIGHYDYAYLFEYDPGTETSQEVYHAVNQQCISRLTKGLDGKVYFVVSTPGYSHLLVYNPSEGITTDLGEPVTSPDNIRALTTGADGRVYVGTSMAHLVVYDSSIGDFTDLGSIPGLMVIWAMTKGLDGVIYGGTGEGYFFVYNPTEAWNPEATSGSNPYNLGQAVAGETRIRSLTPGVDGKIYGGTAFHAHLFRYVSPLTVSITPTSASTYVRELVSFTSSVSGGYAPYTYQWYLDNEPVHGATSSNWAFTPTTSGIYHVYLNVTDAEGYVVQSGTAEIKVTVVVGGTVKGDTTAKLAKALVTYFTVITLMAAFVVVRCKKPRKTK